MLCNYNRSELTVCDKGFVVYSLSDNPFQLDYAVTAMEIQFIFVISPIFLYQYLKVRFLDLNQHNKVGIKTTLTFGPSQLLHINKASLIVAGAKIPFCLG